MKVNPRLSSLLSRIEHRAALWQGKGYGSETLKQEVSLAASLLKAKPRLALDVGANIGEYTIALQGRFPGLEIHMFEPASVNFDTLTNRFSSDPSVTINRVAVSDTAGPAMLFSNQPGSVLGSLTKRNLDHYGVPFECSEEVDMIRLEDYWKSNLGGREIDILKLDVEGHELNALKGLGAALHSTRLVQFEFGGCNIDTRTFFKDFYSFFADNGFRLFRITPFGSEAIERYRETDESFQTTNYIAQSMSR